MYPHRIRLRGPWECEPLARTSGNEPLPPPCRMNMPCMWKDGGLKNFAGRVRFRRRFGLPLHIDSHERVWLTVDGLWDRADIWLNGLFLGNYEGPRDSLWTRREFEVTALLRPRNELIVEVEGTADHGGLWGEVALEIRCTAFLRAITFSRISKEGHRLRVCGQAVGESERALDLYVLADNATVAYATIQPQKDGCPFELISDTLDEALFAESRQSPVDVRVELVNGGVVWYRIEGTWSSGSDEDD
jgi:hypothetical protein